MRAGRLNTPATLLELNADIQACELDWLWCGIDTKESAEPPFPAGLRNPAKVAIRAWWDERLRQGRYLRTKHRLFHIDSARDYRGDRAELAITATEFIGEQAQLLRAGQPQRCVRVFMTYDAPYRDDLGQVIEYRIRAEVALIEAGRVEAGDRITLAGRAYAVTNQADDQNDGIVRGLWLAEME